MVWILDLFLNMVNCNQQVKQIVFFVFTSLFIDSQ